MRGLCRLARFASQAARSGVTASLPAGSSSEAVFQQVVTQPGSPVGGELLDCCQPLYSVIMPKTGPIRHHRSCGCQNGNVVMHMSSNAGGQCAWGHRAQDAADASPPAVAGMITTSPAVEHDVSSTWARTSCALASCRLAQQQPSERNGAVCKPVRRALRQQRAALN